MQHSLHSPQVRPPMCTLYASTSWSFHPSRLALWIKQSSSLVFMTRPPGLPSSTKWANEPAEQACKSARRHGGSGLLLLQPLLEILQSQPGEPLLDPQPRLHVRLEVAVLIPLVIVNPCSPFVDQVLL